MQKPGIGVDYVQRLSGETGDYATLALQLRLAYNQPYQELDQDQVQLQLYNAFFKYKAGFSDLWIGHNRMAFGLASYFDSHAQLLQPLIMQGYGFDRDWGVGATRDFEWGTCLSTPPALGCHSNLTGIISCLPEFRGFWRG
jgi:hypothetical protein